MQRLKQQFLRKSGRGDGFEPTTSRSRTERSTKLSHAPTNPQCNPKPSPAVGLLPGRRPHVFGGARARRPAHRVSLSRSEGSGNCSRSSTAACAVSRAAAASPRRSPPAGVVVAAVVRAPSCRAFFDPVVGVAARVGALGDLSSRDCACPARHAHALRRARGHVDVEEARVGQAVRAARASATVAAAAADGPKSNVVARALQRHGDARQRRAARLPARPTRCPSR